jgi:hypothetical protein
MVGDYAIITAWNPGSILLSKKDNHDKNQELELAFPPVNWAKVKVGDARFNWYEESYAVALSMKKSIELGRIFKQNAIYYVVNNQLFLISCHDNKQKKLGDIRERIQQINRR